MDADVRIFDLQAELCQAMGHPVRLKIVYLLKEGPQRVMDITQKMGVPQPAVSRHLAVLRHIGLVLTERQGLEVIYRIANPKIVAVCEMMRAVLSERETQRLEVLGALQHKR